MRWRDGGGAAAWWRGFDVGAVNAAMDSNGFEGYDDVYFIKFSVHRVQWSVGDVDYNEWASSQSFHPGDTLVFEYHAHSHNVMQVNPSDFKSCNSTAPPLAVYTSGNDVVTFKMAGNYYFICGAPGHCEAGQKVEIKVVPSSPSSSMSGASRLALSPSALSPVPPHTSGLLACQSSASRPLLFGLFSIALSIVFKL
ncbi:hypothetical protein Syun_029119 [Stephania yunnanensis]|uniref:Phytocyanin domain-containing protein n=1 Tax=Stephania yunnanensis TaxID=152371 RepID=A0AAP0E4T0_9MAGN